MRRTGRGVLGVVGLWQNKLEGGINGWCGLQINRVNTLCRLWNNGLKWCKRLMGRLLLCPFVVSLEKENKGFVSHFSYHRHGGNASAKCFYLAV